MVGRVEIDAIPTRWKENLATDTIWHSSDPPHHDPGLHAPGQLVLGNPGVSFPFTAGLL